MRKFYLTLGGGLGDVFWTYFGGHNGWNKLELVKQKFPKCEIKVLSSTHNPQTKELLKYHPNINKFEEYGWTLNGKPIWEQHKQDYTPLKEEILIKTKPNKIYLNEEDNTQIKEITSKGPFILIHPFAGERQRLSLYSKEWIPIIEALLKNTNFNIVIIGGNYTRINRKRHISKSEELNYSSNRVFNLINKTNARICSFLVNKQDSFIGTWSAYACLSWIYNKPNTIILPKKQNKILREKKQGKGKRWHQKNIRTITTPLSIIRQDRSINIDNIIRQVIENYNG